VCRVDPDLCRVERGVGKKVVIRAFSNRLKRSIFGAQTLHAEVVERIGVFSKVCRVKGFFGEPST
jgi:hypothetical protein